MKRTISIVIVIALLLAIAPLSVAQAAPNVSVEVGYSPTALFTGGNIDLSITVSNNEEEAISDVVLKVDGVQLAELGNVQPGEPREYTTSYTVPTEKLGKDISVVAEYLYQGEVFSSTAVIHVAQKQANVKVATTTKVDKTAVPKDGKVTFTFAVENQGDTKIEKAYIKASALNGGKNLNQEFSLEAGKATIINYTATITEDITVEPVLTFVAVGKNYSEKLDTIKVTVSEANILLSISTDLLTVQQNEDVVINVTMQNTGNVDLTDVRLYDSAETKVPTDKAALAAGESMTATRTMQFAESGEIGFFVKAKDADGREYTFNSNVLRMEVLDAEETAGVDYASQLKLTVTVDQSRLEQEGIAVFNITLANLAELPFTNVVVYESSLGNIETYSSFPSGEKTLTREQEITTAGTYVFQVSAIDPDGNTIQVKSPSVNVSLTADQQVQPNSGLGTLLWIVGVVVVLIIGVGITLLVLMRKEKKKREQAARRTAAVPPTDRKPVGTTARAAAAPVQPSARPMQAPVIEPKPAEPEQEFDDLEAPTPAQQEDSGQSVYRQTPPVVPQKVKKRSDFEDRSNF